MRYTTWRRRLITYLILVLFVIVSVIGLYAIFGNMEPTDKASFLLEIGKFLLQIITLIVITGLISSFIRSFEKDRKADKALHDFRSEVLDDLQDLYQKIKTIQHNLRSAGLTEAADEKVRTMAPDEKSIYDKEMNDLHNALLKLEKIILGIQRFPDLFLSSKSLLDELQKMKDYLNDIVKEYQNLSPRLRRRLSNTDFSEFTMLKDFTGLKSDSGYAKRFLEPYENAASFVRKDLLSLDLVLEDKAASTRTDT